MSLKVYTSLALQFYTQWSAQSCISRKPLQMEFPEWREVLADIIATDAVTYDGTEEDIYARIDTFSGNRHEKLFLITCTHDELFACMKKHYPIENFRDLYTQTLDEEGNTASHIAASRGSTDILNYIIENTSDTQILSRLNKKEDTPLNTCAYHPLQTKGTTIMLMDTMRKHCIPLCGDNNDHVISVLLCMYFEVLCNDDNTYVHQLLDLVLSRMNFGDFDDYYNHHREFGLFETYRLFDMTKKYMEVVGYTPDVSKAKHTSMWIETIIKDYSDDQFESVVKFFGEDVIYGYTNSQQTFVQIAVYMCSNFCELFHKLDGIPTRFLRTVNEHGKTFMHFDRCLMTPLSREDDDYYDYGPIMYILEKDPVQVTRFVEYVCDRLGSSFLTITDDRSCTPLHMACYNQDVVLIKALYNEIDCDQMSRLTYEGVSPLHLFCYFRYMKDSEDYIYTESKIDEWHRNKESILEDLRFMASITPCEIFTQKTCNGTTPRGLLLDMPFLTEEDILSVFTPRTKGAVL